MGLVTIREYSRNGKWNRSDVGMMHKQDRRVATENACLLPFAPVHKGGPLCHFSRPRKTAFDRFVFIAIQTSSSAGDMYE